MIMRTDKARQYHLAGRIDHRRGITIQVFKFVTGAQGGYFAVRDDNRAVGEYVSVWVDRDDGCMIDE